MTSDTITPQELHDRSAAGAPPLLVDVRSPAEFASVHAAGARSMPLARLDPGALADARGDPDGPVYLICKSGRRAAEARRALAGAGVGPAVCVAGGTDAWLAAGLPVNRGPRATVSLERQVRIAAGGLVLIGSVLAWFAHPAFLALPAFVGAGLVFAGVTDTCAMGMLLARMPWNR